jgi:uncharacterized BrkB/YihY/UPF0761 family membrane protein
MNSGVKLFSAEDIDRKRTIVSVVGGLGISAVFLYLLFLFSALLPSLCLRILKVSPALDGSVAMSMVPVILVVLILSVILAVLFGTMLQERYRKHRRFTP